VNLLTDDDKSLLLIEHLGPGALAGDKMSLYDCFNLALDVAEKALLTKLAGMELPDPVEKVLSESNGWTGVSYPRKNYYTADQLRQAYVQGAASQLSAEPVASQYKYFDGKWHSFVNEKHYEDTKADGNWPIRYLFTRKEPS